MRQPSPSPAGVRRSHLPLCFEGHAPSPVAGRRGEHCPAFLLGGCSCTKPPLVSPRLALPHLLSSHLLIPLIFHRPWCPTHGFSASETLARTVFSLCAPAPTSPADLPVSVITPHCQPTPSKTFHNSFNSSSAIFHYFHKPRLSRLPYPEQRIGSSSTQVLLSPR